MAQIKNKQIINTPGTPEANGHQVSDYPFPGGGDIK